VNPADGAVKTAEDAPDTGVMSDTVKVSVQIERRSLVVMTQDDIDRMAGQEN